MISLYGGSGFVGGEFKRMYDSCIQIPHDQRKPKSNKILYFISTVDNYNVYDNITLDVDTNLHVLCQVLDTGEKKRILKRLKIFLLIGLNI